MALIGPKFCDFCGKEQKDILYDARTKQGPWAYMCEKDFKTYAVGKLGTGFGQKFKMEPDGKWKKIDG